MNFLKTLTFKFVLTSFISAILGIALYEGYKTVIANQESDFAPEVDSTIIYNYGIGSYNAKLVGCYDGDGPRIRVPLDTALGIDTTYLVRLYGVDAPEHDHLYVTRAQLGDDVAADLLRKFVRGKDCRVETVYIDEFDRAVCRVFVNDSIDLTHWALKNGVAWERNEPSQRTDERTALRNLRLTAQQNKVGFWVLPGRHIRPETFRRNYSAQKSIINRL